jgi:RNA polymerase sigma-32 factor
MLLDLDPAISRYIKMVNDLPQLDRETELALARRWKEHADEAARDALVQAQLRYVVAIALSYRRYRLSLSELIAEGNFGLVRALTKFDPERGNRLLTYASHWIRAYMLDFIIRSWSLVGGGSGALRSKMFFKVRRERVLLKNLLGEGEQVERLLAQKLNLPQEKLTSMLRQLDARDVRLDPRMFDDSTTRLVDMLPSLDRNQEEIAASAETNRQLRDAVRSAIAVLDERERYIVEKRLMADSEDELSLSEIGRHFGVSRERARQLEQRTKQKLRTRIKQLERVSGRDFLDLGSAA